MLNERFCEDDLVLGSIKSNIGHLEPAAGIAGLLKLMLVLQHEQSVPNSELRSLNPRVAEITGELNARFPTALEPLRVDSGTVCGLSSFGYAGTLAHAIVTPPLITSTSYTPDEPDHTILFNNMTQFRWV
jgi:acyl transferase domain-containing protein